eukprot:3891327-Prymnesium_polylepis.1
MLNTEQLTAVADVVANRHGTAPYVIFGPPGTGKTMVVIETVLQLLLLHPDPRILLTAPSNAAADVLAKRLQEHLAPLHTRLSEAASRWPDGLSAVGGTELKAAQSVAMLRNILLRLNSQTRPAAEVLPEVLPVSFMDAKTGKAAVPSLRRLLEYRV